MSPAENERACTPGSSRQKIVNQLLQPGAPSRALRLRAADGLERFMRRVEGRKEGDG